MSCNRGAVKGTEVLSPAGSMESLVAAVRAGADAVYLGGRLFSARAGAQNFSEEDFKQAVAYCHARGVRVHLAMNTLLLEQELPEALQFLEFACSLPVDAVLVQDMGLALLIRRCAPSLALHASTQTSVHTAAGVRALSGAGFERAVLAREMSLSELREASSGASIETEAFVHGALCMSVSGQCYFSAMLGSRSGNRGQCAQPCRLPFSASGGTGHDLSLKDLSLISRLSELFSAGVTSAKIEGRMKRPEYVAAATAACRLAADGKAIPPALLQNLGSVFSRSGFTSGYPDAALGREMFGVRSQEDAAAATQKVFASLRELTRREAPRVPVRLALFIALQEPVSLTVQDGDGHTVCVTGPCPEPARTNPLTAARCTEQLNKTGGTPFYASSISCSLAENCCVPASVLNSLRRQALDKLLSAREAQPPIPFSIPAFPSPAPHGAPSLPALRAFFQSPDQVPDEAALCELVFLPGGISNSALRELQTRRIPAALAIPRGLFGIEKPMREALAAAPVSDVWCGTLDAAQLGLELGKTLHGGFSLNVTNSAALCWYREFGLADTELSPELTLKAAQGLADSLPRGLAVYGRLPLMLCRNCPAANAAKPHSGARPCVSCKRVPMLTDRKGASFPVLCSVRETGTEYNVCSEVLNSVPLYLADRLHEVKNMDFLSLRFTTETRQEAARILRDYHSALCGDPPLPPASGSFTRGLYYRGIF